MAGSLFWALSFFITKQICACRIKSFKPNYFVACIRVMVQDTTSGVNYFKRSFYICYYGLSYIKVRRKPFKGKWR